MFKDSSLQENLLFQNSKKFWELFFLSFSEKKNRKYKMKQIFSLFISDDFIHIVTFWWKPFSLTESRGPILKRFCWISRDTRLEPQCYSLEIHILLQIFRSSSRFAGCQQPIVKTELNGNNPTVHSLRIIDLTDLATLNQHIPSSNERGRNFANAFQEVLIEGFIPPECISLLHCFRVLLL